MRAAASGFSSATAAISAARASIACWSNAASSAAL